MIFLARPGGPDFMVIVPGDFRHACPLPAQIWLWRDTVASEPPPEQFPARGVRHATAPPPPTPSRQPAGRSESAAPGHRVRPSHDLAVCGAPAGWPSRRPQLGQVRPILRCIRQGAHFGLCGREAKSGGQIRRALAAGMWRTLGISPFLR